MSKKITRLKVEQVPCKDQNFKEFKITYKYKGKNIADFKTFDKELYKNKSDRQLKNLVKKQTRLNLKNGKLVRYAHKFTGFTRMMTIVGVSGGVAVATAVIVPTTIILTKPPKPYIEPDPECTTLKVRNHTTTRRGSRLIFSYTLGDDIADEPATVNWGDGNTESLTTPGEITHVYTTAIGDIKDYDIVIEGDVSSIALSQSTTSTIKSDIVDITLGEHITTIGESAFKALPKLKAIYIPSTVDTVVATVEQPLYSCSALEEIKINSRNEKYYSGYDSNSLVDMENKVFISGSANSVIPSGVKKIGQYACFGNALLKSVRLPSSVEEIEKSAFANTPHKSQIVTVKLNDGLKKIGPEAFQYTLIENLDIPDTVIDIGYSAFDSCENLSTLKLSSNLVTIGDEAFMNCFNLTGNIIIPSTTTTIGGSAFAQQEGSYNEHVLDFYILNPNLQFTGKKTFNNLDFGSSGDKQFLHVPFSNREEMVTAWGDPGNGADENTWMGKYNQYGNRFIYNE